MSALRLHSLARKGATNYLHIRSHQPSILCCYDFHQSRKFNADPATHNTQQHAFRQNEQNTEERIPHQHSTDNGGRSVALRSPSSSANDERKQKVDGDDALLNRHRGVKYSLQEAILAELRELKTFIEENSNEPSKLVYKMRIAFFNFEKSETTAVHRCEALRRVVWLCTKYMTDKEWFHLMVSADLLTLFDDIANFLSAEDNQIVFAFMSVEEICDILWTFSELSMRPSKLIAMIVKKLDRLFYLHKESHFGYQAQTNTQTNTQTPQSDGDMESEEHRAHKTQFELETHGYTPGQLQLPFKSNELSDIFTAYGMLRIESGNLIQLLDAMIREHYEHAHRMLDLFLPKDLSTLCVGYAMMDSAFHWYKIVWGLNRHLNILSEYISWTQSQLLDILHYDVCMRYINRGWNLQLTGVMQTLIDDNCVRHLPRTVPPFYDPLLQAIHETLDTQMLTEQWYAKNVEGYQVPFSRWPSRDEPGVIEVQSETAFLRLDEVNHGRMLNGRALLRQHCLRSIFKNNIVLIKHYEWPATSHLQQMYVRTLMKQLQLPLNSRLRLLQHGLEPHYQPLQKDIYD